MQVVRTVQRVEVQRSFAFDESPIDLHRRQIRHHRVAVVAAQHVDMAGHVPRWPASGTRLRSRSAAGSASCGVADISIVCRYRCRSAGVFAAGGRGQRVVEDPLGLHHPRPGRRLAGSDVPQRPRRDVDQRVGGQRLHVDVVGIRLGESDHGVGVGGVPGVQARRCRPGRRWGSGPAAPRSGPVRRPMRDPWRPGRVPSAPGPATPPDRPGSNASHALL